MTMAGIADRDTLLSMSGLDFMRGILEGRLPPPPIAGPMGYRLTEVEPGRVCFRGAPGPEHLNPMGSTHGGWYGTVIDSAMGCAAMTAVPKGKVYTTLEYRVHIIRPIPQGMEVEAEGLTDHAGRATAVVTGRITGVEDGKLYATGTSTCIIMAPR